MDFDIEMKERENPEENDFLDLEENDYDDNLELAFADSEDLESRLKALSERYEGDIGLTESHKTEKNEEAIRRARETKFKKNVIYEAGGYTILKGAGPVSKLLLDNLSVKKFGKKGVLQLYCTKV